MTTSPQISVITPVYNTEKYLAKTLQSVINQTFTDWELICVDDGSTDSSPQILAEFKAKDSRIIVLRKENSGRASVPFNLGLAQSRGRFVYPLGCDDFLSPDCLQNMLEVADITRAQCVLPDLEFVFEDNPAKNRTMAGINGDRSIELSARKAVELSLYWHIHGFALTDGDLFRRIKYDEEGMNGDEYSVRLMYLNCEKIAFSGGIYHYLQRSGSITKKMSPRLFDVLVTFQKLLNLLVDNHFDRSMVADFAQYYFGVIIAKKLKLIRFFSKFSAEDKKTIRCNLKKAINNFDCFLEEKFYTGSLKFWKKKYFYIRSSVIYIVKKVVR